MTLEFDKYVPEISGDEVRAMLAPVFDFKALTGTEAYQKTLPPKLQAAIRDHQVLVGMDKEMVMYAKGRPQQRIRDKDEQGPGLRGMDLRKAARRGRVCPLQGQ